MFKGKNYLLRQDILSFPHKIFKIFDDEKKEILFLKKKAFKLKEDIRIYTDSTMSTELIAIKARNIIDFAATYDIVDSASNIKIGALRRKGLVSSFGRDTWHILDINDTQIGEITEDNLFFAILRKFLLGWLFPQNYNVTINSQIVCNYKRNFNPFVNKIGIEFKVENNVFDRRLGISSAILLCAIEGKQR